jgi:hypothetical protein
MTVSVPESWFVDGATIEVELPRNLTCAACDGGGCDRCERSGAVTLRGRKEPAEMVEVTIPRPLATEEVPSSKARVVILRIPERGGLPGASEELPRGNLLLSVRSGADASRGVKRLAQPSIPPPPPVELVARDVVPKGVEPRGRRMATWVAVALVTLALAWWFLR